TLKDAQTIGRKVLYRVADGEDPHTLRRADREGKTFEEAYKDYLKHAIRNKKSWEQGKYHVDRHVLPYLGKRLAKDIVRREVRKIFSGIESRSTANAVLAHTSSVFTWCMEQEIREGNPCVGIESHEMTPRSRWLSDTEIASFWAALDRIDTVAARVL